MRQRAVWSVPFLLIVLGALLPVEARGQEAPAALEAAARQEVGPDSPQTFGIADEIAHVVTAAEFDTLQSSDSWGYGLFFDPTTGQLERTAGGGGDFLAGLRLPAGVEVTRLEVAGCDFSVAGELRFALLRSRIPPGTGLELVTPQGATGVPQTPTCGRFSVTPSNPPLIIDNANASYFIRVGTPGASFDSVRVYYRLKVSAAPGTATFSDVPTSHPFFQYIEALVASGITAGCAAAPPRYCPDDGLTRGQMAVFLGKALGLHFAP